MPLFFGKEARHKLWCKFWEVEVLLQDVVHTWPWQLQFFAHVIQGTSSVGVQSGLQTPDVVGTPGTAWSSRAWSVLGVSFTLRKSLVPDADSLEAHGLVIENRSHSCPAVLGCQSRFHQEFEYCSLLDFFILGGHLGHINACRNQCKLKQKDQNSKNWHHHRAGNGRTQRLSPTERWRPSNWPHLCDLVWPEDVCWIRDDQEDPWAHVGTSKKFVPWKAHEILDDEHLYLDVPRTLGRQTNEIFAML